MPKFCIRDSRYWSSRLCLHLNLSGWTQFTTTPLVERERKSFLFNRQRWLLFKFFFVGFQECFFFFFFFFYSFSKCVFVVQHYFWHPNLVSGMGTRLEPTFNPLATSAHSSNTFTIQRVNAWQHFQDSTTRLPPKFIHTFSAMTGSLDKFQEAINKMLQKGDVDAIRKTMQDHENAFKNQVRRNLYPTFSSWWSGQFYSLFHIGLDWMNICFFVGKGTP